MSFSVIYNNVPYFVVKNLIDGLKRIVSNCNTMAIAEINQRVYSFEQSTSTESSLAIYNITKQELYG
jgi:hypothetical protein